MIQQITQRLQEINTLLVTCLQESITFEQAMLLSQFYKDFNETNQIVTEAAAMFQEDAEQLNEISFSLFSEAERFLSLDVAVLQSVDFENLFEANLKPFELRYEEAKDVATGLWREYSAMSSRLDFLPPDSEDYKSLAPVYDAPKAEYDTTHHLLRNASRNGIAPSADIVSNRCSSVCWSKNRNARLLHGDARVADRQAA